MSRREDVVFWMEVTSEQRGVCLACSHHGVRFDVGEALV